MQVRIIAVGKIREHYLQVGINEYKKRLNKYIQLQIISIPDEKVKSKAAVEEKLLVKKKEGTYILNSVQSNAVIIALNSHGEMWSSEDFANQFKKWKVSGQNYINFIIGGELGLSEEVLARCNYSIALSRMTYPYQIAQLILLEQIYRACRIIYGEPYHR